ncbi:MAG: HAMP domain-containing protein [Rhodothermales bacterium]|nr:HAMP domain-containing protein [Rhodothermales bacterium]
MRLGLANRFALIFSLLVLVATATVGYFVFRGARHSLIVASTDRLADNAEIVATRFNAALDGVAEDVRFLAGTPPVDGLARIYSARRRGLSLDPKTAMSDTEWRALLSDVFRGFLANRPMYRAVHLVALDRGGSELGRAERQAGEIVWVPTSELERLGEEEVVREGSTLGRDTLYVSNITFAGGDTGAAVPVLQAALPIYGPTGDAFGLLILDVDVRPILSTLSSLLTSDKSLYLADSEGTVLVRPIDEVDPAAAPARLQALFPDVDPLLDGEERSIRIEQTRVGPQRVVSAYFERFAVGVGTGMDDLVVGVTSPHEAILGGVRQVRTRSFIITVLFGFSGILFALAFARHLTRPLRRITRALSSFGRGEWAEELPVDRRDEIGLLATTFVEMADQIQQQVVELEQKELRQRTILETSAEGIIVTDADGVVETFNPAAAVILGVSPAEALGRRIDTMIKAADAPDRDGAAGPVPGLHPGREAVGVRPDGSQVPLDVTWSTFDLHGRTRVTLLV